MLLASSVPVAVSLSLLSLSCWGSWTNSIVLCGGRLRFEAFYLDYSLATLLSAALAALTLGVVTISGCEVRGCSSTFLASDFQVDSSKIGVALAAGMIFNVGNIMLAKAVQMSGLAVVFPLCVGTCLVLGTLLCRLLEGKSGGNAGLLFGGVAIAFVAVCTTSLVHRLKDLAVKRQETTKSKEALPAVSEASSKAQTTHQPPPVPFPSIEGKRHSEPDEITMVVPPCDEEGAIDDGSCKWKADADTPRGPSARRKLLVCLMGGLFLSLWSPLLALCQKGFGEDADGRGLSPYGAFFFFTIGILFSTLMLIPCLLRWPLDGTPSVPLKTMVSEYRNAGRAHGYGFVGGFVWAVGTFCNILSGELLSLAASYAIGNSAPMVSIFWGVVVFKEFKGAPWYVSLLLILVSMLYASSIACIALSQH